MCQSVDWISSIIFSCNGIMIYSCQNNQTVNFIYPDRPNFTLNMSSTIGALLIDSKK